MCLNGWHNSINSLLFYCCFRSFPGYIFCKANKKLKHKTQLKQRRFSSILEIHESAFRNLFERYILFATRSAHLPAFQKIPGAVDLLVSYVQCNEQWLYEKLW